MTSPERLVPIDILKSVGILTVVWIHAVSGAPSSTEVYLLQLARFAVPAFLAASGYLYASREPVAPGTIATRLRRLLVPYLVASTWVQLFWWSLGEPRSWSQIAQDLLYGSSFGPYYYVFVITTMVLLTPLLSRLPAVKMLVIWALLVSVRALLIAIAATYPPPLDLFWVVREPTHGGTYFIAGWVCALYRPQLGRVCARHWSLLFATSGGAAFVLSVLAIWEDAVIATLASWLNTLVVVGFVTLISLRVRRLPRALRFLSDASYALYLYHLFFAFAVMHALPLPATPGARLLQQIATATAGLVGPAVLVVAARRVMGASARTWIGA